MSQQASWIQQTPASPFRRGARVSITGNSWVLVFLLDIVMIAYGPSC